MMSENQKPKCQLTGVDGNVFNIIELNGEQRNIRKSWVENIR